MPRHFSGRSGGSRGCLVPLRLISNLARVMSLTIRLYANMFASDLLTLVFFSMIPIGVPVIFLGCTCSSRVIQAYVFMLLTLIYLSIAVSHEDEVHA